MKTVFIIAFLLFMIFEILILIRLQRRKQQVGVRSTLVSVVVFFLFSLTVLIFSLKISYILMILAALALFLNSYVGYDLRYFERSRVVDRFLHAYGTFALTLLFFNVIIILTTSGGSKLYRALFVFCLGIALGAVHEIMEFVADLKHNSTMQKGLRDTNYDIVFNILGSAAAAFAAWFFVF